VRRGRMFQSTINEGNTAVAYDVTLPNRPQPEPAKGETTPKSRAAAKRAAKSAEPTPPPPPTEEPF